jgi:hypothetical protein
MEFKRTKMTEEQYENAINNVIIDAGQKYDVELTLDSILNIHNLLFDIDGDDLLDVYSMINFDESDKEKIKKPTKIEKSEYIAIEYSKRKIERLFTRADINVYVAYTLGIESAIMLAYIIKNEQACLDRNKLNYKASGKYFTVLGSKELYFRWFIHPDNIEKILKKLEKYDLIEYKYIEVQNWFFVRLNVDNVKSLYTGNVYWENKNIIADITKLEYCLGDPDDLPDNTETMRKHDNMFEAFDFVCYENKR